ncbi:unnamed protein product, partial [Ectocarpus fasciculatus]
PPKLLQGIPACITLNTTCLLCSYWLTLALLLLPATHVCCCCCCCLDSDDVNHGHPSRRTSVGYMHAISTSPAPPPATRFFQKGGEDSGDGVPRPSGGHLTSRGILSAAGAPAVA